MADFFLIWCVGGAAVGFAAALFRGKPLLGHIIAGGVIGPLFGLLLFLGGSRKNDPSTLTGRAVTVWESTTPAPQATTATPTITVATFVTPPVARGTVAVVGEAGYQLALRALLKTGATFRATLRPEPDNPHDPCAIAVHGPSDEKLGYLRRPLAEEYHARLTQLGSLTCEGELVGGTPGKPNIGVVLAFDAAREALRAVSAGATTTQTAAARRSPPRVQDGVPLNEHGQPLGLGFNAHRRTERDISQMLGIMKGLLADGVVNNDEATYLREWIVGHPEVSDKWPVCAICQRLERVFADGRVEEDERQDLKELLEGIIGGKVTMELKREDGAAMPYDNPPPTIIWPGMTFVFTGQFAYGTRPCCEGEVAKRGGICHSRVTVGTAYLIIGTFGSRDWVQTSYGRKIEQAVDYRAKGVPIKIVGEDHWAQSL